MPCINYLLIYDICFNNLHCCYNSLVQVIYVLRRVILILVRFCVVVFAGAAVADFFVGVPMGMVRILRQIRNYPGVGILRRNLWGRLT